MSDLALTWVDGHGDLVVINDELMLDDSLTTAIVISLFTDLRVGDERGWWGDDFGDDNTHRTGSKLWLLGREKQLQSVLDDAQTYATQALSWLIDDKLVIDYQVVASTPNAQVLLLTIIVTLPDGSKDQLTFSTRWSS